MIISFCLPNISKKPSGGYKMVFEYANRLTERGHTVNLIFFTHSQYNRYTSNLNIKQFVGGLFNYYYPKWFTLNKQINKIATAYVNGKDIPNADFIFATAVETADIVKNLPKRCGKKAYFIQDFENWNRDSSEVINTYRYNFTNITVSGWLREIVKKYSENVYLIKNPIDIKIFKKYIEPEDRNRFEIGMLYHEGEYKGCKYAIEAIKKVRTLYPNLRLNLFGTPKTPDFLESWMHYTRNASNKDLIKIYNKSAIFVCASISEGFGLTGAESMACGCAFVSTSYLGVHEYAQNGENALLSPIKDVDSLSKNIVKLIENDDLRIKLAKNAEHSLKKLSWEIALSEFEEIMKKELSR